MILTILLIAFAVIVFIQFIYYLFIFGKFSFGKKKSRNLGGEKRKKRGSIQLKLSKILKIVKKCLNAFLLLLSEKFKFCKLAYLYLLDKKFKKSS